MAKKVNAGGLQETNLFFTLALYDHFSSQYLIKSFKKNAHLYLFCKQLKKPESNIKCNVTY